VIAGKSLPIQVAMWKGSESIAIRIMEALGPEIFSAKWMLVPIGNGRSFQLRAPTTAISGDHKFLLQCLGIGTGQTNCRIHHSDPVSMEFALDGYVFTATDIHRRGAWRLRMMHFTLEGLLEATLDVSRLFTAAQLQERLLFMTKDDKEKGLYTNRFKAFSTRSYASTAIPEPELSQAKRTSKKETAKKDKEHSKNEAPLKARMKSKKKDDLVRRFKTARKWRQLCAKASLVPVSKMLQVRQARVPPQMVTHDLGERKLVTEKDLLPLLAALKRWQPWREVVPALYKGTFSKTVVEEIWHFYRLHTGQVAFPVWWCRDQIAFNLLLGHAASLHKKEDHAAVDDDTRLYLDHLLWLDSWLALPGTSYIARSDFDELEGFWASEWPASELTRSEWSGAKVSTLAVHHHGTLSY